ncbi:MAG: hypothetical protein IT436_17285 [Phycisphaerales bacterium]|nr:hypothetical protein [Phycisphaerales bacterium]
MFALNEGYQWKSSHFADSLHGAVYLAAGNHAERMRRSVLSDFAWQLFDPQLYLAGLEASRRTKVCARLATYPWFGVTDLPDFDSGNTSLPKWQARIQGMIARRWPGAAPTGDDIAPAARSAVEFQADRGCTHIILPTPLIDEREDEAQAQGEWIDAGLEAAQDIDVGQPIVATVALSEGVLNDAAFNAGGFLDTIVDQVSSRDGVSGAYIVVAQLQSHHPLQPPESVSRAYAHLTRAFVKCGYDFVFVNFADAFGVACVGLGAAGFATGPSQSLRRLSLAGFQDEGGGIALPHLYSHPVVGEFLPERDLSVLAENDLLAHVKDQTVHSGDLFSALERTGSAANVRAWLESKNNLAAATKHFIARMIAEGTHYSRRTPEQRAARAERWLTEAARKQATLAEELDEETIEPTFAPAATWLEQYREGS